MKYPWKINETPDNKLPDSKFYEYERTLNEENPQTLTEYARILEVTYQVLFNWSQKCTPKHKGKYKRRYKIFFNHYYLQVQTPVTA